MGTDFDTDPIRRDVVAGSVALSLTAGIAAALRRTSTAGVESTAPPTPNAAAPTIVSDAPPGSVPATSGLEAVETTVASSQTTSSPAPAGATAGGAGRELSPAELHLHVARRLTYGPTPDLLAHIEAVGVDAFLVEQLEPGSIDDSACDARLRPLHRIHDSAAAIADREERVLLGEYRGRALADLRAAAVVRSVHSRRQLFEVVVGMWTDHLNIWGDSGEARYEKVVDDRDVIRRHALGRFADLLVASGHSPAMLRYLDNHTSRAEHPNENYARELLELHTLGAGNHSERDVRDTARVLTGWSIDDRRRFRFDPANHDDGPATVAGWSTPGRGGPGAQQDGVDLLVHLARHPATARNVATRIARRFVADSPPPALVDHLASVYLAEDTAIAPVIAAAVRSPEFVASWGAKYRRPFEFTMASLRALGADLDARALADDRHVDRLLEGMGHRPFSWEAPDGFPDQAASWRSPNDVVGRWSAVSLLTAGHVHGVGVGLAAHHGPLGGATVGEVADRIVGSVNPMATTPSERDAVLVASGRDATDPAAELDHRSLAMMVAVALAGGGMQVR